MCIRDRRKTYLEWVARKSLQLGDFYAYEGMEVAASSLLAKLRMIDEASRSVSPLRLTVNSVPASERSVRSADGGKRG